MIEILATLAAIFGVLMSLGHFSQAYKIWKRKSAKDVSLITFTIFWLGDMVWLAYGIAIHDWPLMASFTVGVLGTTCVMILALKYR